MSRPPRHADRPARDAALLVGCRSALVRAQMVAMLMGTRTSPWGTWALPG